MRILWKKVMAIVDAVRLIANFHPLQICAMINVRTP
jgi:hypothetical protein